MCYRVYHIKRNRLPTGEIGQGSEAMNNLGTCDGVPNVLSELLFYSSGNTLYFSFFSLS